jgi:hypothetical protein
MLQYDYVTMKQYSTRDIDELELSECHKLGLWVLQGRLDTTWHMANVVADYWHYQVL